jgi:hypothetical protein
MAGDPTEETGEPETSAHGPQAPRDEEAASNQDLITYLTSYAEQLEQELGRPDTEIRLVPQRQCSQSFHACISQIYRGLSILPTHIHLLSDCRYQDAFRDAISCRMFSACATT